VAAEVVGEGAGEASDLTRPKVEGALGAGGTPGRGCGAAGVATKLALAAGAVTVPVVVVVAIGGGRGEGAAEAWSNWVGFDKRV
jgi:hypothetical protein